MLFLKALTKFKRRKSAFNHQHDSSGSGELPEQCQALAGLSIDELRAKLEEAEQQSARNRHTIHEVGEIGTQLLNEEAQLEAKLDGCQSSLVDTAVVEQLPSSIYGKHGELRLPAGPSGQKIYRQIVKQHMQVKRLQEEIIGLEENLVENMDMLQEHLRITRHNFAAGFTGAMKFATKLKKRTQAKEDDIQVQAKKKGSDQNVTSNQNRRSSMSHHIHALSETVKEDTAKARLAAEKRGHERAMMVRELLDVGRASSSMMADLRQELEETRQRNSILQKEFTQHRESRHDTCQALFDSMAILQNELDDISHNVEKADVEIRQAHSEYESVHADHRHVQKICETRRSLAAAKAKALEVPKLNIQALATHDEASSEDDSDGSSEIYYTGNNDCANDKGTAERVMPIIVSKRDNASKTDGRKKRNRKNGRHGYKDDMEVVVHTEKKPEEKTPIKEPVQVQESAAESSDMWGAVSWYAWTAAGTAAAVMGDVLLKVDEMTRTDETEQPSKGKTRTRRR